MRRRVRVLVGLPALWLALAACVPVPHPFAGPPTGETARLVQPPPPRLAVPVPANALLADADAKAFATDLAEALLGNEVPAQAVVAKSSDWRLVATAEMRRAQVIPHYAILNPAGVTIAHIDGLPEPAASWARGDAGVLQSAAQDAAPKLAELLTSIDAAQKQNDPHSLYHRPSEVAVLGVTGAPGDGDTSLARQLRLQLPQLGVIIDNDPKGADFTIGGEVRVAAAAAGNSRVEIQWQMRDANGHDLGRIVQINEVPNGTLDQYWGDVAIVVAQQAALGMREVIEKQRHPPPGVAPLGTSAPGKSAGLGKSAGGAPANPPPLAARSLPSAPAAPPDQAPLGDPTQP
jgi:hypothetical protein